MFPMVYSFVVDVTKKNSSHVCRGRRTESRIPRKSVLHSLKSRERRRTLNVPKSSLKLQFQYTSSPEKQRNGEEEEDEAAGTVEI
ncbi:hypothetical protein MKW98_016238 [Papaver atlanticum]|uniref:Uncharacterized protein n=1 Tax=Papaver atlanticum TaxID=357466 RepID=A0AAD4SHY0_9MAGN|nr:hypothetical protein MKW98_016238 [Papaver atlanticum]